MTTTSPSLRPDWTGIGDPEEVFAARQRRAGDEDPEWRRVSVFAGLWHPTGARPGVFVGHLVVQADRPSRAAARRRRHGPRA